MTKPLDDASLPTDKDALKAEIVEVERRLKDCLDHIKALADDEDPARGVFHAAAIHEAKQLRMMLQYQKDVRVARLNRMKFV